MRKIIKRWYSIVWKGQITDKIEELDPVSKYLAASRAVIDIITVISVLIAGLLALLDGSFNLLYFILCLIGLLLMHSGADLMNDYYDYKNGLDTKDYFRVKYLLHPVLDNLYSIETLKRIIIIHFLLAFLIAIYLALIRGPLVILFFALGVLFGYFYQEEAKLKYYGLGEISTFIVWGPLMVGGTYFVLTGNLNHKIFLASVPYALMVMLILFGKHIDKLDSDKAKNVKTLPVILGLNIAKKVSIAIAISAYLSVIFLAILGILPYTTLLVLFSITSLYIFIKFYRQNRKDVWYVALAFWLNRQFGLLLILGLVLAHFLTSLI